MRTWNKKGWIPAVLGLNAVPDSRYKYKHKKITGGV
jgi:hypothetical protein